MTKTVVLLIFCLIVQRKVVFSLNTNYYFCNILSLFIWKVTLLTSPCFNFSSRWMLSTCKRYFTKTLLNKCIHKSPFRGTGDWYVTFSVHIVWILPQAVTIKTDVKRNLYDVVSCAIIACSVLQLILCNNFRLSNVMENIHEAKMLQPWIFSITLESLQLLRKKIAACDMQ